MKTIRKFFNKGGEETTAKDAVSCHELELDDDGCVVRDSIYHATEEVAKGDGPSYSCTMLMMPPEVAAAVEEVQAGIAEEDLGGHGLETECHLTLLYGTHTNDLEEIKGVLREVGLDKIRFNIGKLTSFPPSPYSEGMAVLKYDVTGADLIKVNKALAQLEHTSSFKDYHAHITVAYVKVDAVDKYVGSDFPDNGEIEADEIMFSTADREKTIVNLSELGEVSEFEHMDNSITNIGKDSFAARLLLAKGDTSKEARDAKGRWAIGSTVYRKQSDKKFGVLSPEALKVPYKVIAHETDSTGKFVYRLIAHKDVPKIGKQDPDADFPLIMTEKKLSYPYRPEEVTIKKGDVSGEARDASGKWVKHYTGKTLTLPNGETAHEVTKKGANAMVRDSSLPIPYRGSRVTLDDSSHLIAHPNGNFYHVSAPAPAPTVVEPRWGNVEKGDTSGEARDATGKWTTADVSHRFDEKSGKHEVQADPDTMALYFTGKPGRDNVFTVPKEVWPTIQRRMKADGYSVAKASEVKKADTSKEPRNEKGEWTSGGARLRGDEDEKPALTDEQRQERIQMLTDMMASNKEIGKPIPQGWVNRMAELKGGTKPTEGEIFANVVQGHPQHEVIHQELRNLVPIKIQKPEDLDSKFLQSQALLDKLNKQIGTLEYAAKTAPTPAKKKAAALALSKLSRERDVRDTVRDEVIPELNRLHTEALKRQNVSKEEVDEDPFEHMDNSEEILTKEEKEVFCRIAKSDAKKQIVYGMVYAPDLLDQQGDMMTAETIEEMAHSYLRKSDLKDTIDHDHDNAPKDCYPVESWIQKNDDPDGLFLKDSWCMGIKINDPVVWAKVEKGEINGFSFQGTAARRKVLVEYEYLPTIIGITEAAEDGHTHTFLTKMDIDGKPTYGRTSAARDGHYHLIHRGTATDEADKHKHRINLKTV